MTNQEHSIKPSPELVEMLQDLGNLDAIELAYQAGANHELEACCKWTQSYAECGDALRLARRPKPQSLKKQALAKLAELEGKLGNDFPKTVASLRRALEALPND